jgi:hypothetical protein
MSLNLTVLDNMSDGAVSEFDVRFSAERFGHPDEFRNEIAVHGATTTDPRPRGQAVSLLSQACKSHPAEFRFFAVRATGRVEVDLIGMFTPQGRKTALRLNVLFWH